MGDIIKTAIQHLRKDNKHGYYQLLTDMEAGYEEAYPRPQMKRQDWVCLNGEWNLGDQKIRLPFPPQAALSGYQTEAISDIPEELLYERSFRTPGDWIRGQKRILLHFGAVDQIAQVFVNGRPLETHYGGYLPFTLDITDYVRRDGSENILSVFVIDHLDHTYPWGKQKKDRGGMWYTPCSGIWQTVWMEAVPASYIAGIRITPVSLTRIRLQVETVSASPEQSRLSYRIRLSDNLTVRGESAESDFMIDMEVLSAAHGLTPISWSPEHPHLYPITICYGEDRVDSYFALRTIEIRRGKEGREEICLNGKAIFLKGLLDQGYWPDGLFLPPSPEGYTKDVAAMKEMGFNLLRKHIKIEPEWFYYECDRQGMLVMQDMVNNGPYSFLRDTAAPTMKLRRIPERSFHGISRKENARKQFFLAHATETQEHLYNHPCIVAYTIFNEGWGQFAAGKVGKMIAEQDPGRIYDYTSGWFDDGSNPINSIHDYFSIAPLTPGKKQGKIDTRPLLLSECGGYSWKVEDHSYAINADYGYGSAQSAEELTERIEELYSSKILPSIEQGLCGFIYTQVSDIEDEVNGLYTYDRKICKVIKERIKACNDSIPF